jgi:hypothetical protein
MTYEGIEYVVRIGVGRGEWALLIYYPDKAEGKPTVTRLQGTREAVNAAARQKIRTWLKNQKRKMPDALKSPR